MAKMDICSVARQSPRNSSQVPGTAGGGPGSYLIQVQMPNGGGTNADYIYDLRDNLVEADLTDKGTGKRQSRLFQYDALNRLYSSWNPESGTTDFVGYDSLGNLTALTTLNVRSSQLTALPGECILIVSAARADVPALLRDNIPQLGTYGAIQSVATTLAGAHDLDNAASLWVVREFARALGLVAPGGSGYPPPAMT